MAIGLFSAKINSEKFILQIKSTKPDKFTPRIMENKNDYVRVEYQGPILGVGVTHNLEVCVDD